MNTKTERPFSIDFRRHFQTLLCCLAMSTLCLFHVAPALAQKIEIITEDQIQGQTGELLSLTVRLKNNQDKAFQGILRVETAYGLRVIGETDRAVQLDENSSRYFSIRLRIDTRATSGELPVSFFVYDDAALGNVVARAKSTVQVREYRSVFLQALTQQELMQHPGDSVRIPVYVRNAGNTTEYIRILSSTPSLQGSPARVYETKEMTLEAGTDTTVVVGMVIDNHMLSYEQFFVHLTGMYSDAEVFGNTHISVQNAASKRAYASTAFEYDIWSNQQNQLVFSTRNLLEGQHNWQLQARATHQLNKTASSLSYSLNLQQWNAERSPVVNNTWIRFDKNNKGFTLGNISESLEKHVFGRGLTLHSGDATGTKRTEVGVVDKGYNLLGYNASESWFDGLTAYIRHSEGQNANSKFQYNTLGLYDIDPYENAESFLYANTLQWLPNPLDRRTLMVFHLGAGLSRPLQGFVSGIDTVTTLETDRALKPSLAASINASSQWRRYTLSSNNYISTGFYPGTRRGILQLNERLTRKGAYADSWIGLHLSNYEPSYFTTQRTFPVFFAQSRVETGVSFPVTAFLTMSVSPRYENERGRYFYETDVPQLLSQQSMKVQTLYNWRSRNIKHFTSLSQEFGWITNSNFEVKNHFHYRGIFSYSYRNLNVSTHYQYGNFSVSEQLYAGGSDKMPSRLSLNFNYSNRFFSKRLQLDWGTSLYRDYQSGNGLAGTTRVQYNYKRTGFFLHTQWFNYYHNALNSGPTVYTQVGLIQKLPNGRQTTTGKRGRIAIFTYYDNNNNGRFDAGDEVAKSKSVMINNTLFLSDASGEIKYTQVPYNTYKLSVPVENGWYAPARQISLDAPNKRWEIPLQRSGTLRGSVRFNYDPRLSMETNTSLEGYSITAIGANGAKFHTRTDNRGNFLLFLPVGNYEVFLNEKEFPNHVFSEMLKQEVTIQAGKVNQLPEFELKVQRKSIEVKRFGSE